MSTPEEVLEYLLAQPYHTDEQWERMERLSVIVVKRGRIYKAPGAKQGPKVRVVDAYAQWDARNRRDR